ncbi:DUF1801 domain-containing protein [Nocardia lijiangensis]|uniref:DUF1801 domain-containing protein n=1 Tax=Nocardia lijiangensis TaxID=299618 RepID=UPI000830B5E3|nr:DUF1801 domain-containing protein [Nocardia lijiangensis]
MDNKVTDYIAGQPSWQAGLCEKLRQMIHDTLPGVEERLLYGKPHYLLDGDYAAVISVSKGKVSFMVFNATDIPEVKGFLRSLGNGERKAVTFAEGQAVDYTELSELLARTTTKLRST